MTKKTTFETLSAIDCSKYVEKKNNLTYLSWAWAWGVVKTNYYDANYEVVNYDGKPYLFDEHLGYLVSTRVTIDGETIPMSLPVMDGANRAQKHVVYQKFNKDVQPATMFDINTAIMRCLTKNLAMFGLGHYIYAGEDIPKEIQKSLSVDEVRELAKSAKGVKELEIIYRLNLPTSKQLADYFAELKKELEG